MKFLLVRPHVSLNVARRFHAFLHLEPLDLEIVAGGIDPRHETTILDITLSRDPESEFESELRRRQPDVVGFGGYSNQARNVKRLAAVAKRVLPAGIVIVGGVHATIAPEDYRVPDSIDLIIRGEGGTALRRLVGLLERDEPWPEDNVFVPVRSPRFDELARLPPPELPEHDDIPKPRRMLVDRSSYYCIWSGEPGERLKELFPRVATMRTSTGCPFRCSFCVVHFLAHGKYLQRAPEDVVDEIAAIPENHIYFVDDEMFINGKRTERIAELILERGIRKQYISWARSDTICRNPEVFRLWKKAGLTTLYVGLESMEGRNLQQYEKGYEPEMNRRAVAILRDLGIGLHAALMVNPDFTKEDFVQVRRTIDFVLPAEVSFTVFSPPPGTELWKKHAKDFICEDPYTFYDCMHTLLPAKLPLNEFYRYFSLLYLFAFRGNPWRRKKIRAPWRDVARLMLFGAKSGWALRRIYRDFDRKLW
jgi:hopanoid C-3 methylase